MSLTTARARITDRLDRSHDDAGFTLTEMLVYIVIFGIIGTMLGAWFIGGVKSTAKSVARTDDLNATHVAIQRLTRDIQLAVPDPATAGAGPILTAGHDTLTMYTKVNGLSTNPGKVTWSVTSSGTYNGTLVRTFIAPSVSGGTASWPAGNAKSQNILYGVNDMNDGKIPTIFRYLDATNAAKPQLCSDLVPVPGTCPATAAVPISFTPSDPMTAATTLTIDAVEIYLQSSAGKDGVSSTVAPYYESSLRTGVPFVVRARVYPLINTVTTSP